MAVIEGDPFGDVKSAIDSKNQKFPPDFVNKFHASSDVDNHSNAQHHTLGPKANQSSPGNHIHDGKSSKPIGDGMGLSVQTSSGTADQKIDRLITELKKIMSIVTT